MYSHRLYLKTFTLLLTIFLACQTAFAQQLRFTQYSKDRGLPGNQVWDIYQDNKGYMWFSTTAALVKYNGKEYQVFDKSKGLLEEFALNVRQDSKGNIWVGCPSGISKINNTKIKSWTLGKFDDFHRVFIDSYDRVWAYNFQFRGDIYFIENDSLTNFSRINNFKNQKIQFVNEDKKGAVHFLTSEGRLYKYFTNMITEVPISNLIQQVEALMFFFDSEGNLILCGQKGAAKILYDRISNKPIISWVLKESVSFGLEGSGGYYWLASRNKGLFRIKVKNLDGIPDKSILNITMRNGLPTDNLFNVFEDREENIWIGTNLKGISKLSSMRFVTYGIDEGFSAEAILSMVQDQKGAYCLTEKGIYKFNNERFNKIGDKGTLSQSGEIKIYLCMLQASQNSWIIGGAPGLYRMDENKNIELIGLPQLLVQTFLRDSKDVLWIGTNKGIYKYDNKIITSFQYFGTQNRYINKLIERRNKDLYAATDSGLVIIENGTSSFGEKSVRKITTNEGLLSNMINDLEVSFEGDIIIGTSQGINVLNSSGIYSIIEGLNNRFVAMLFFDSKGQLWAGTDNGLHLLKKMNGKYKVVALYLQKDGMMSNEFTRNGTALEDSEGRIWFGTYSGLTVYNPSENPSGSIQPYCYLTAVNVNDSTLQNIDTNNFEFGYAENKISFLFDGLSFFDEDATRFEYYLEPLEKSWSNSTILPSVSYGYLEPGNYTFNLRAVSSLGNISYPQKLSFTISTPFWKQIWFLIVISIFVLISSYIAIQYRVRLVIKRNLLLKKLVNEKTNSLQISNKTLEEQNKQLLLARAELVEKEKLEKAYEEITILKNKLTTENIYLKEKQTTVHEISSIVGKSQAIHLIRMKIMEASKVNSTVLITGETGVGKNLIAEAIHTLSSRKDRTLITVNCAAIPDGLVESELFGHEKGAFTGANERRQGKFEIADGSTIFLDEIGDMNIAVQAKILNVLEERKCTRVGGTRPININVRIIAATNYDIENLTGQKKFRRDLYYRLNVIRIDIPPLRERKEDIEQLSKYFIDRFAKSINKKIEAITTEALNILKNYSYPGNVRELENIIQRAIIICKTETITNEHIVLHSKTSDSYNNTSLINTLKSLDQVEREYILNILERTGWKIGGKLGAAEILGVHPNTLRSRMLKLKIPFRGEQL